MSKRFDIHAIVAKGKESVRPYQLPAGEVLIRPLTEIEMEECELAMFESIEDPDVLKFAAGLEQEELATPEDKEEELAKNGIDYLPFLRATNDFLLKIAYLSMKDFTDDFEIEDLKKIRGIRELAMEVQRISGYNKETAEAVENFR